MKLFGPLNAVQRLHHRELELNFARSHAFKGGRKDIRNRFLTRMVFHFYST